MRNRIIDIIFPPRCAICDQVTDSGHICDSCSRILPYVDGPVCYKCGKPLYSEEQEYCHDCETKLRSFEKGYPVFKYVSPIQDSIMTFKYRGRQEYAIFYGDEIYKRYRSEFQSDGIDLILPVPINKRKYTTRGYNQAELVASRLSQLTGIRVSSDLLIRRIDTKPQKELSVREREMNLRGAFTYSPRVLKSLGDVDTVLLVDDIYTTGATMQACTEVCHSMGIDRVYCTYIAIGTGD